MSDSPDTFDPHIAQKPGAPDSIDVRRAFRVPFEGENWFVDLLLVLVCLMIPIIGPIVMLGYKMELIEGWLKRPDEPHTRLDFGRFTDYLKRGVWPFLAALVGQLIAMPLTFIVLLPFYCLFFGSSFFFADDDMAIVGMLCMVAAFIFLFVGIIAVNVLVMCIMTPMMLGAGLSGEIGPGLDFAFVKDFLRRTWKDMAKAYLLFMVSAMLFSMLGCCVLIVGMYFVMAWTWMVMAHLYYQAYILYLARGGKPIQPKPELAGKP